MNESGAFEGFPDGTFEFLRGLSVNNDKSWFDRHRRDYESFYLQPALAFIATIGPRLQAEVDPAVKFEPRINGSLFRIQRDVRFSKDKTPYKTNLDVWFWRGDRKGWDTPGFFLRLTPEQLILGAGMHQFGSEALKRYREAVLDARLGTSLTEVVAAMEAAGAYEVGGETRKTVPRGFDPQHERARFLKHEGLHAGLETALPPEAASAAFVDYCLQRFKAVSPINGWLQEALAQP
jgi:uncharacterized protein (TIGR02453 family)